MPNDGEFKTTKKDTSSLLALIVFVSFLGWGYYYLFTLRPMLNRWLSQYISAYPAMLHLVPILAVPVLVAVIGNRINKSSGVSE